MFRYVFVPVLVRCLCLEAGPLPDYDSRCNSMFCHPAEITSTDYFYKAVPKKVHQIWFGDQSRVDRKKIAQWKVFSEKFGYEYVLWTEQDDSTLQSFMLPQNFELMVQMRQRNNYWAASDIVRFELMKRFGGVYIDCDFLPPSNENGLVDLQDIINFHGLTLMTEHYGRDIGSNSALFAANGFIVSSSNHPVICSIVDQVYDNTLHWNSKEGIGGGCGEAAYCTGPFLLNKVLTGCFNIVPCTYLEKYRMDDTKF